MAPAIYPRRVDRSRVSAKHAGCEAGGYRLPGDTLEQLSDLMREGLDLLRCSRVIFDAGWRQREIAAVRLTLAKNDPGFQELLSKTAAEAHRD